MNYELLNTIKSPDDLKALSYSQLEKLAAEVRSVLISSISNTGGHLASNLGVVELTIAVHKVFNSPADKIIFDVGHQCYTHKLLTGRFEKFGSLRKSGGLSGFPNPCESVHDVFMTGHSSTSISSALGLATAAKLKGDNSTSFVAVIGDGAMTGGLAYEALNNAGRSKTNLVVILNDNDMSISKNVGAIAGALTRLRSRSSYFKAKDIIERMLRRIPKIGDRLCRGVVRVKSALKSFFYKANLFEDMGFVYMGPVDGHDIRACTRLFERAKSIHKPVLVHVNTIKGKGYAFAEEQPKQYHGVGSFDIITGKSQKSGVLSYSEVFGQIICELGREHSEICAITAAMGVGCCLSDFNRLFANRCFDVGIAESHAVTFAGGLAKSGMLPVFAVYSTFLQRSYDQIIHDISIQNLKMIFAVDRAGVVADDGQTHQGLFDIPFLLPIPNLTIFSPATVKDMQQQFRRAVEIEKGTVVIRYPKGECVTSDQLPFLDGGHEYECIQKGSMLAVISYGRQILNVYNAVSDMDYDISIFKLNKINKFSNEMLDKLMLYRKIILFEESYEQGSVGWLLEDALLNRGYKGSFKHKGIANEYIGAASTTEILEHYGLDTQSVKKEIERFYAE